MTNVQKSCIIQIKKSEMILLIGVSQPLNENYQTLVFHYLTRMLKLGVSQPKVRMLKRRDRNISPVFIYTGENSDWII